MFEKLKEAINFLINKNSEDIDKYPFSIVTPDNILYYAEKYVLICDSEFRVCGVRWGTAQGGVREFHGTGFLIAFNPLFQMGQPDIKIEDTNYHG